LDLDIARQLTKHSKVFTSPHLLVRLVHSFSSPAFRQRRIESIVWRLIAPFSYFARNASLGRE
jgi:hypothetical protein